MGTTEEVTRLLLLRAQRTPFNIAPEKAQALAEEVFGAEEWRLQDSRTEANFYAVVPERAIYASYAGLASLWCLSFVAFHAASIASCAARSGKIKDEQIDISNQWASMNLQAYLDYARRLFHANEAWPENICEPKPDADLDSTEGRVNNLFFGALSWILLHEIAHVHHGHSHLIPASLKVGQEYQADAFATMWVLCDAGSGLQREFRVIAVSVALAWLFLHEQAKGQGSDHPAAILRFRDAVASFNVGDRSTGLENATYMLKAIFDPATEMPTGMMANDAFVWMCERLEVIFGGRK